MRRACLTLAILIIALYATSYSQDWNTLSRDGEVASLEQLADDVARLNNDFDWLRLAKQPPSVDFSDILVRAQNGGGGEAEGGGAGAGAAVNPSVPLSQIQFQNVFIPESYGGDGYANQFVVQPVIAINRKPESYFPYHVIRATFPVLAPVPDPDGIVPDIPGTGDTTYFDLFFHPTKKKGVTWGVGPVIIFPTSTDASLLFEGQTGLGEWQLGPSAAILDASHKGWVMGALFEAPFSVESDAYSLLVQPILTKLLKNEKYIGVGDLLWKLDDQNGNYNFPLSIRFGKVFKAGKQPINVFLQPEYTPSGLTSLPSAKYGLKLNITFLLPGAEFGYCKEKAAQRRCRRGCRGCYHCGGVAHAM